MSDINKELAELGSKWHADESDGLLKVYIWETYAITGRKDYLGTFPAGTAAAILHEAEEIAEQYKQIGFRTGELVLQEKLRKLLGARAE